MRQTLLATIVGIALLAALPWGCTQRPARDGIHSVDELRTLLADPPAEYRSAPLWVWHDRITEEGIDFQMNEFKKAGIGGVFVHPRPGLITEYLSDEWFKLFDHAVQKGKELGLKVWIYDENSYPSGFAGGHVPAEMPDSYRHGTGLSMEVQQELNVIVSDTVAVVLKKSGTGFEDITAAVSREYGRKGTYYVFRKTYPGRSAWYGGFTYVDLLYPGVTEKFMDLTMTRGYEKNAADFGSTVLGIFTDEPNLEAALGDKSLLRWTPDLWDAFQRRWGYDLRVHLPSLVEETGDWKKARHDYYELLVELFVDRWARPWSRYSDEKRLKWTGHYWEHGWPVPTDGMDEAAFYIWHQMPGVDMLGNTLDTAGSGGQFGNDRAVRELLSAANQAGRRRTLSETYGGGGWDMTFAAQKRLVDWECALGVNFVNQHLSYYSLNGVRKFDYPPSFSYHEPWWSHYKLMGDYIGRISMAMSSGEQLNRTLVLQPNTTAWMYFSRTTRNPALDSIRTGFKSFVYRLEQHHLEYDLGSESVLKVLGSVQGDLLRVGKREYSLVVIPAEMENIDSTTYDLLAGYVKNGGRVLSFRKQIPMLNGEPSTSPDDLMAGAAGRWTVAGGLDDPGALQLLVRDDFVMADHSRNGMLYHQRRVLDDGELLFVVNSHPERAASATVTLRGTHVSKLDLLTGKTYGYPSRPADGRVSFDIDLGPAGSALFVASGMKTEEPAYTLPSGNETLVERTGELGVRRESENVLMVNYLDLTTARSTRRDVYFMDALKGLFKENGVEMGNPWQHKIQYRKDYLALDTLFGPGSWFEASYRFSVKPGLEPAAMKSIQAVVERPGLWRVFINGEEVPALENSYWIERQFPRYAIGGHVRPGMNTLTLKAPRMDVLAELMPVYILGDFLVRPAPRGFEITGGDIGSPGSWRDAGLPFYSQTVAYTQQFTVAGSGGWRSK